MNAERANFRAADDLIEVAAGALFEFSATELTPRDRIRHGVLDSPKLRVEGVERNRKIEFIADACPSDGRVDDPIFLKVIGDRSHTRRVGLVAAVNKK